jgi:hypothetical protein
MNRPWLDVVVAALLFAAGNVSAGTLQARLIRATNDPEPADARLNDIEPKLKKKFGYTSYQQLGAQEERLQEGTLQRLDLGEGFVVFAKLKGVEKKSHELEIEWTSGKASLVKSTVKISAGHHLFIKGPGIADDWIVLALTVRE